MHAVLTRAEALDAGLTPAEIERRLRGGLWVTVRRGVYATEDVPREDLPAAIAAAVVRSLGGEAVASHATAAQLHGLPLLTEPHVVSVTRPKGSARRLSGLHVHVAGLPPSDLCVLRDLPVTAPARTVVDLARRVSHAEALVAADAALRRGLVRRDELDQVLVRCATWPGVIRAARVVRLADGRAESALETLCRDLFRRHQLPASVPQGIVADPRDGWWARVDFLWPEQALVVEADGRLKYGDAADLWEEKLRQERIEELGYAVRRLTWAQVTRSPEQAVARVARALARTR